MRIAIAQINPTVGDLDGNTARMLSVAEEAASQDADLLVYGAHALTGAPLGGLLASAAFVNDVREHLEQFARACPLLSVVSCPVPVEDEDGELSIMPELLLAGPEGLDSFGVPLLAEDGECPVVEFDGESVALLYENHFAEGMDNRELDVLVEITADAFTEPFAAAVAWGNMERARQVALDCGAWVANVNLCGGADTVVFAGNSSVVNPQGQLAFGASIDAEELFVFDTDAIDAVSDDAFEKARLAPDAITWTALTVALRDYVTKNGFSDVVVGVSGGLDSAVVTALAVDALGAEHVHGVLMPGPFTSDESNEDAEQLCDELGVEYMSISIDAPLEAFHEVLSGPCGGAVEGLAAENLQARMRMVHLMTLSNTFGWMVLNTGNKSEAAMGFSTLYGDTCGAFAPIGSIYKSDVYDLAEWRMELSPSIPERILTKAPSAELYEGGVDADRLPPYDELDDLLFDHIEGEMDASGLREEGHDAAMVEDVLGRVVKNEYKRRAEPLAPNVLGVSFSQRSWPVTNAWRDRS